MAADKPCTQLQPSLDNSAKVPLNERALLTVAVASASMIAGHLLVIANQVIEYLLEFSFALKYCFTRNMVL